MQKNLFLIFSKNKFKVNPLKQALSLADGLIVQLYKFKSITGIYQEFKKIRFCNNQRSGVNIGMKSEPVEIIQFFINEKMDMFFPVIY